MHSGEDGNQNYLRPEFMERVNSRHGTHTIDASEALGIGTQSYEVINIDNE